MAACSTNETAGPNHDEIGTVFAREVSYTPWTSAISAEQISGTSTAFNTVSLDGCPFISPDGKKFFMASNRAGGLGGIDIWVATREKTDDPWGAPVNVGAPVNSTANDFCPTIARDGHTFFFVSNRAGTGTCGGDDIYVTRLGDDGTFEAPTNLGCAVNSAGNEAGPSQLTEPGSGPVLYFSSNRAGGFSAEAPGAVTGDADIYRSEWVGGSYAGAVLVPGVNSAENDIQPNLQRDGVEMYFASNRTGVAGTTGTLGGNDIFVATRASAHEPWRTPMNLGGSVNTSVADETRPSLSWDALTLYFGSNRPGGEGVSDIYVTTRERSGNN
jgi:Tol biopolymer transport system component